VTSRILSTLLLWTVIGASLSFFGLHAAVILIALLATLTLHEFYTITEKMGAKPFRWLGLILCVVIMTAPFYVTVYLTEGDELVGLVPGLLALSVVLSAALVLGARDNSQRIETLAATVLGLLYVPFMLHHLVLLLMLYADPAVALGTTLWVVAVSKFCDVGALLSGLAFGRHKLAPVISPKKTWEGAIGGVLVSAGLGAALAYFLPEYFPESLTPALAAPIGALLAVVTIVSDLIESALKRRADVKDSGTLIPGIGGAFDLTDSLILTAPVAYFIFTFLA